MKFKAHADMVVVKIDKAEEKTSSGIFMPQTSVKLPNEGVVVEVGEGKIAPMNGKLIPTVVKVGDRIMFAEGSGTATTIENVDYRIIRESDIIGTFTDGN